jgi:hypothetical protein
MAKPTLQNLTEAANFLVKSNRYARLRNEIDSFVQSWHTAPKQYAGELAVLNPLIVLGVDHPDKYQKMLGVVDAARKRAADTRRTDYQRVLMQRKRRREANAIALEEWTRGKRFTPTQRENFLNKQRRVWDDQRVAFLKQHASDPTETRAAAAKFWELIDFKLDTDLNDVKQTSTPPAPPSRKKVVREARV